MREVYQETTFLDSESLDELMSWWLEHREWQETEIYQNSYNVGVDHHIRKGMVKYLNQSRSDGFPFSDQIILHIEEFARNYNINIKEDEISWSFLKYESGDFFQRHKDVHIDRVSMNSKYIRKVSFSMQLSEPYKYEGGRLLVNSDVDKHIEMSRERGSICMFPSWVSHEVTPVTKGTRYSLVAWQNGPFYQ